ncbi:heme-degrading domain-containing protein [Streptomyces sp. 150FB]|uniref:heme-degrading domain-containing protein n=1 Tax=Streptomyces sp. 150FB TaxID=1576605 RepID=UPI00099DB4C6
MTNSQNPKSPQNPSSPPIPPIPPTPPAATPAPAGESAPTARTGAAFPTVAELEAQEARLVLPHFTYEDAWALGNLLVELARERRAPVAIDIRRGAQQLFHCALPGSSADNDEWINRKRRVVERYGASSFLVGARFRAKGSTFEESSRLDVDTYAAHGGSFPIAVEGAGIIGTVTVSGLPQVEDHAMVVEALEHTLRT